MRSARSPTRWCSAPVRFQRVPSGCCTTCPALASSYAYVNPAIAVALGAWLAGNASAPRLLAMGVILLGVVAITVARATKAKAR